MITTHKRSILRELVLVFILALVLPIAAFGYYIYDNIEKTMQREVIQTHQKIVDQIAADINNQSAAAAAVCDRIAYSSVILQFLVSPYDNSGESFAYYQNTILPLVDANRTSGRLNIYQISIYSNNETIPESWPYILHSSRVKDQKWYHDFWAGEEDTIWLGPRTPYLFDTFTFSGKGNSVYACVKKVRYFNTQSMGIVAVETPINSLLEKLHESQSDSCKIYALNSDGTFCVEPNSAANVHADVLMNKDLNGANGNLIKGNMLYIYETLNGIGVKMVYVVTLEAFSKELSVRLIQVALMLTGIFAILTLVVMLTLKRIFLSFNGMLRTMDTVASGQLNARVTEEGFVELSPLVHTINTLIEKINQLIADLVKQETAQKDVQLLALQYQINPHFIYNTIDIFRMKLTMEGKNEVAGALTRFGKILRYNLSAQSKYTTLKLELEQVEHYIYIQQVGAGTGIELRVRVPEELRSQSMIKFVIQPIVENSVRHGRVASKKRLVIGIFATCAEGLLCVDICDNGRGIAPDALLALNHHLKTGDGLGAAKGDMGIGLGNISHRLRLFYGESHALAVQSKQGYYTRVMLRLPIEEGTTCTDG